MSMPAPQLRPSLRQTAARAGQLRQLQRSLQRARLTVVPRRKRQASRAPFMALVSMLAVGGVVGLLLFNTSMQQASFAATSLQEQATNLSAREESLRMELDKLRDPQVVALKAQRMGMVLPANPTFLRLSDGKILGTPAPGVRGNGLRLLPPPPVKPAELAPQAHVTVVHVSGTDKVKTHGVHQQNHKTGHNTGHTSPNSGRGDGRKSR